MSTQQEKLVIIKFTQVERVPNTFENLNSSEMTLKMLKTSKYIKNTFFGFFFVFLLFLIFLKIYQKYRSKIG